MHHYRMVATLQAGTVPDGLAASSPTEATSLRLYIEYEFAKTTAQLCLESCTEADCVQRLRGCVKGCTAPVTATVLHRPDCLTALWLKVKVPLRVRLPRTQVEVHCVYLTVQRSNFTLSNWHASSSLLSQHCTDQGYYCLIVWLKEKRALLPGSTVCKNCAHLTLHWSTFTW